MRAMPVAQPITADEFLTIEVQRPLMQLVDGEIVVSEPGLLRD